MPAAEIVLSDEEKAGGIEKLKAEAKRVSDKLRKQMKTEEAHRVSVMADELTEEWGGAVHVCRHGCFFVVLF